MKFWSALALILITLKLLGLINFGWGTIALIIIASAMLNPFMLFFFIGAATALVKLGKKR